MKGPLVSICCIAYNHTPYIHQCLEGFLIQKTTFPFETLIHDDASIDGIADIIREYEARYPHLIKSIYQIGNQYSKGIGISFTYNYPRAKGKYIAPCEGDGCWTDPLKLQKQIDFLESHTDYSICFHSVWKLENGNTSHFVNITKSEISAWDIINNWLVPICSVLCREISLDWVLYDKIGDFRGDFNIFINLSQHGRIHCISSTMRVYRTHSRGVTVTHLNSIKS